MKFALDTALGGINRIMECYSQCDQTSQQEDRHRSAQISSVQISGDFSILKRDQNNI